MSAYSGNIVHYTSKDLSLSQLKDLYDKKRLITDPDYQRNYIYSPKKASSLIESILIGIPIPIIYLCEEDDGTYSVIDGQQRITSFVKYLKNEYTLTGLNTLTDLNGKYYGDLDEGIQTKLDISTLKTICFDRDSQKLKYEIFARLNLGAIPLKPQELRNCIYRGSFNDMLKDIVVHNPYLTAVSYTHLDWTAANIQTFTTHEKKLRIFSALP